jgi:hypothetical protein
VRQALATAVVVSLLVLAAPVIEAAPPVQDQLYEITSPRANETVRGSVEIVGSARLPDFQFYKVEYASSATPEAWVVIGDTRHQQKTNETLEVWHTTSLPDGGYLLHLVVVRTDGNYVATEPLRVTVANAQPAPTPTPEESPTPTATVFIPTPTTAIVEQPTVVRSTPTATFSEGEEGEILPTPTAGEEGTVSVPGLDTFVKQFVFGAFVATVLFVFAGVVLVLRRLI